MRLLRELLRVSNIGPVPPALLALSDAGRIEKYGLLSLLKLRLPKILIVDGSFIPDDKKYATYLLKSLELARKELHCEFVGVGGRDVLEEIQKKYVDPGAVDPNAKQQPRSYRFIVRYYDKGELNSAERYVEASRGEILIIAPRHPDKGKKFPTDLDSTWSKYESDTREKLDLKQWGPDTVLRADEVDRLTFCCCECCHSSSTVIQWASQKLCVGFPSHSTANQFFTPSQFTAYHREGYRACVEARVEEFLNGSTSVTIAADPQTL